MGLNDLIARLSTQAEKQIDGAVKGAEGLIKKAIVKGKEGIGIIEDKVLSREELREQFNAIKDLTDNRKVREVMGFLLQHRAFLTVSPDTFIRENVLEANFRREQVILTAKGFAVRTQILQGDYQGSGEVTQRPLSAKDVERFGLKPEAVLSSIFAHKLRVSEIKDSLVAEPGSKPGSFGVGIQRAPEFYGPAM